MERMSFKSFQPKEVGEEMDIMCLKWRVLSCKHMMVNLSANFAVDQYEIEVEEIVPENNATPA